ncbi:hypothetical protein PQX77_000092 [Marasmius sp. AFHP31]|nr:hypothetical protein PQX77_000092 [Marasmius sp. AFHP31]
MEKYSAYRDPGTGIQPFLTPIPPPQPGTKYLLAALYPIGIALATVRTTLVLVLTLAYVLIVQGVLSIFLIAPPVHRLLTRILTSIISRLVLLIVGYYWIPVEVVARKRGRAGNVQTSWKPRAGDIIVSNWASWVEILWFAFRFNPIFVLPVPEAPAPKATNTPATPIAHTPGRRTGTGSANITSPNRAATTQIPIVGFQTVSLLTIIKQTGLVPPFPCLEGCKPRSLEQIRQDADRPLVVFPECTSSNGRGLLRFANIFKRSAPVPEYGVFIACVRYDPPTTLSPTPTLSIPSLTLNPLSHIFTLTAAITAPKISIRLLSPAESPSSPLFLTSEVVGDITSNKADLLTESCATLIAQLGKLKRMSMGWEDKARFLDFYRGKRTS